MSLRPFGSRALGRGVFLVFDMTMNLGFVRTLPQWARVLTYRHVSSKLEHGPIMLNHLT